MPLVSPLKPYQQVPIAECGEPLLAIPLAVFAGVNPHPYQALGAPYGDRSPFWLRAGVLHRLHQAQANLQRIQPGWCLQIYDAYRPIPVQQFMVEHSFGQLINSQGWVKAELTSQQVADLYERVFQFWAKPSHDPCTPPPHSTGAALDLTLLDAEGCRLAMGGEIDEIAEYSHPDFYAGDLAPEAQVWHRHRQLLRDVMHQAGFRQHPNEWWHFSYGDQLWAWQAGETLAVYGGVL
jgi:zinc D-Ala-D-Ala dipeptidase